MARRSRADHRSGRHSERIEFARDQRMQANEFAMDVWQMLRARRMRGEKFRREHPIPPYTVDFVCLRLKLVIEVDGEHHLTEVGKEADRRRDKTLRELGYEVVRIEGYRVIREPLEVRRMIESAVDRRLKIQ